MFRWFFPGISWVSSSYWSVTKVVWKAWRLCKVSTEVVFCWTVTEKLCVLGRGRVYTRLTEVKCISSLAWACCEVLCGITAFVWNKYPCCVFRHPCALFRHKLPPLKTFEPVTACRMKYFICDRSSNTYVFYRTRVLHYSDILVFFKASISFNIKKLKPDVHKMWTILQRQISIFFPWPFWRISCLIWSLTR